MHAAQGAGGVHILVSNAGLTLTYHRAAPPSTALVSPLRRRLDRLSVEGATRPKSWRLHRPALPQQHAGARVRNTSSASWASRPGTARDLRVIQSPRKGSHVRAAPMLPNE